MQKLATILCSLMAVGLVQSASVAALPAPGAAIGGTYQGTIGALPVRACFDRFEWGMSGGYYYRSRLQYISLVADPSGSLNFREGPGSDGAAPIWSLSPDGPSLLTGSWSQGRRRLPVQLRQISKASPLDSACGKIAFHQPRLDGVRNISRKFVKGGVSFTRVDVDLRGRFGTTAQSTIQLVGDTPAIRKINKVLYASFATNPPAWLDCVLSPLESGMDQGDYDESHEFGLLTHRWLSVRRSTSYSCGGAHPDSSATADLFDRATGAKVDLLDWFGPKAVSRERSNKYVFKKLTRPFAVLVSNNAKGAEAECRESILQAELWDLELTASAMLFTPGLAHAEEACAETYQVPHARLTPFLNSVGRAEIARLHAEAARTRRPR